MVRMLTASQTFLRRKECKAVTVVLLLEATAIVLSLLPWLHSQEGSRRCVDGNCDTDGDASVGDELKDDDTNAEDQVEADKDCHLKMKISLTT